MIKREIRDFAALHSEFGKKEYMHREYGFRSSPKRTEWRKPLVHCCMTMRYNQTDERVRPMLAWECRREGGILWAFEGCNRWQR